MRAVVQRVARARVVVDGREVSSIGPGLVVLLGVRVGDDVTAVAWMADKIANLRIFPDHEGRMNRSVSEAGGACIVVSQFTLYGDARRGRRPSFVDAARPEQAAPLVEEVVRRLREGGLTVGEGVFGAHMDVELTGDGPVTIVIDSP